MDPRQRHLHLGSAVAGQAKGPLLIVDVGQNHTTSFDWATFIVGKDGSLKVRRLPQT